MKQKHQVHNLIILDESGSMEPIKNTILQGFNEVVQTIKGLEQKFQDQEHFITFISFNGLEQKVHHYMDAVSKLSQLNDQNYRPDASTPLFDAMGFAFNKLRQSLAESEAFSVLVTILTDGEENASIEFNANMIKKLIEELQKSNWTFTYIGTDHDVEKMAQSLSINSQLSFRKDGAGIKEMFAKEKKARMQFSIRMADKSSKAPINYFDTEEE